jgi:hypothetical protein
MTFRGLSHAGIAIAAAVGALLVAPASSLAIAPPTLSVSLSKLPAGAGYAVTAHLSQPWPYCHTDAGSGPPDLAWTRDPRQAAPDDRFAGALVHWTGDERAPGCGSTSWRTPASLPFGDPFGIQPAGKWYFQVELSCPADASDPQCVTGMTYTAVVGVKVPKPTAARAGEGNCRGPRSKVCHSRRAKQR